LELSHLVRRPTDDCYHLKGVQPALRILHQVFTPGRECLPDEKQHSIALKLQELSSKVLGLFKPAKKQSSIALKLQKLGSKVLGLLKPANDTPSKIAKSKSVMTTDLSTCDAHYSICHVSKHNIFSDIKKGLLLIREALIGKFTQSLTTSILSY
jgi:hypothetical protein